MMKNEKVMGPDFLGMYLYEGRVVFSMAPFWGTYNIRVDNRSTSTSNKRKSSIYKVTHIQVKCYILVLGV